MQQELDDIINTNSFREIPENVVTTGGRTITLPNGKTVTLKKQREIHTEEKLFQQEMFGKVLLLVETLHLK
ncbi:MAG: hypothetical protein ACLT69_08385 [Intestinibacter bartlettii]